MKKKVRRGTNSERNAKPAKFAEGIKSSRKKPHDSFFKTAFKEPKRTAELLRFAAKRNNFLAEFIDAVDLSSMKPLPTEGTRIDLSCASDLSFCVKLKHQPTQTAELLVGVVLEHKSFPDNEVLYQLEKYFFTLVRKVGLPFRLETIDVGNELPHIDMEKLDPAVVLALVSLRMASLSTRLSYNGPKARDSYH